MDIEKLMNEPDQFFSGVTARITEQAIEFENRCIGEALSMWQIRKEDVLKRIHEADKLQAENEKLRAELERVTRERGAAMEYRFAPAGGYEDVASGRVLLHRSGQPPFPARPRS